MPQYSFVCCQESGGCGHTFEKYAKISDYEKQILNKRHKCPSCHKIKPVRRELTPPLYVGDSSPKTVGALADRNTDRMSDDHRESLMREHTKYLDAPFTGKLPEGASLVPRDKDGKRIPSSTQRKKDPKKKEKK